MAPDFAIKLHRLNPACVGLVSGQGVIGLMALLHAGIQHPASRQRPCASLILSPPSGWIEDFVHLPEAVAVMLCVTQKKGAAEAKPPTKTIGLSLMRTRSLDLSIDRPLTLLQDVGAER